MTFDDARIRMGLRIVASVGLIGALTFHTGGGLKRAPFVPFLLLLLAYGGRAGTANRGLDGLNASSPTAAT